MANPEHIKILQKGTSAWNQWRSDNPEIIPDLKNAELSGIHFIPEQILVQGFIDGYKQIGINLKKAELQDADLSYADLSYADLKKADLTNAKLQNAKLQNARLKKTNFHHAKLIKADLTETHLTEACFKGRKTILVEANFTGSKGENVNFKDANLMWVNFQNCHFDRAKFQGASLIGADFKMASVMDSNFEGATLTDTKFEGTDLRGVKKFHPNSSFIRHAHFSSKAKDWWSTLRYNYTGPKFIFHLIFLIAFIIPFVAKAYIWVGVNHSQQAIQSTITHLEKAAKNLDVEDHPTSILVAEVLKTLSSLPPCLSEDCTKLQIWQILLGYSEASPWHWVLTSALLLYNILRGFATWKVNPLRDEEERSGYSPPARFDWLIWLHRCVQFLGYVAFVAFMYNAYYWLTLGVDIPAR